MAILFCNAGRGKDGEAGASLLGGLGVATLGSVALAGRVLGGGGVEGGGREVEDRASSEGRGARSTRPTGRGLWWPCRVRRARGGSAGLAPGSGHEIRSPGARSGREIPSRSIVASRIGNGTSGRGRRGLEGGDHPLTSWLRIARAGRSGHGRRLPRAMERRDVSGSDDGCPLRMRTSRTEEAQRQHSVVGPLSHARAGESEDHRLQCSVRY